MLLLHGHVPKIIIKIHSSLDGSHEGNGRSNEGQKHNLKKSCLKEEI
jgi:hypothetical protein